MRQLRANRLIPYVKPTALPEGIVVGHRLPAEAFPKLDADTPKHRDGQYDEMAAAVRLLTQDLTPANQAWLAINLEENSPEGTQPEPAFDAYLQALANVRWQLVELAKAAHGRTRIASDGDSVRILDAVQLPVDAVSAEEAAAPPAAGASAAPAQTQFFNSASEADGFVQANALDGAPLAQMSSTNLFSWWEAHRAALDARAASAGRRAKPLTND